MSMARRVPRRQGRDWISSCVSESRKNQLPNQESDHAETEQWATGADGRARTELRNRIYRVAGRTIGVALEDTLLNRPNGITWDRANRRFVIVPFGGSRTVHGWVPGQRTLQSIGTAGATQMDGVEVLDGGAILIATQSDGSLHAVVAGVDRLVARTAGRPADIALDTRRNRVAVPFVALNQVEIWQLPR
jgi:sugar lactone lactonase YvrE